ncbi:RadC family protein [Geothrix sp. PMB-07]|uniref:JAB domain-containing protein n=1 Tax=Geothrix sp. PMB-07 TaxID=3068640 RepID=UPI0027405888|nr:JAB domain-containing protein [Geothrix sp. PMB-07]WLT30648.1 JAB domain-containing protein [Geothrix sp. PMB-07]
MKRRLFSDILSAAETVAVYGPEALTDEQIIEAMLDTPSLPRAAEFMVIVGGFRPLLAMGPAELTEIGLTESEAARISVLVEVQRRSTRKPGEKICSPRAAGAYLLPKAQGLTEEVFGLVALNAKGGVLADRIIARGTATACMVSPREFFREALRFGATTALAWHNHPSGDPTPSREDAALTKRLRTSGDALGVPLADHIIIGETWHSFRAAEGWDR